MASPRNAALVEKVVVEGVTNRIEARVEELKTARQTYLDQAQRQMAAFDAAIGELEALTKPPAPAVPAVPEAAPNGAEVPQQYEMVLPG